MDVIYISAIFVLLGLLVILRNIKSVTIYEYERGVLFRQGKYQKELKPGRHWYFDAIQKIQTVDVRTRSITVPGQEILSSDNVGIKLSLAIKLQVEDPYRAIVEVADYFQAVYLDIQVSVRDIVGSVAIDDLLGKRQEIGQEILEHTKEKLSAYGILLESVAIKDIMFPGDLKGIFAQVVNARKEGVAALERARGESAALRNLANSAKLLEKNPGLLPLRILQTLDNNPGNTIILGDISDTQIQARLLPEGKKKSD
jgi:regulator of protease activity HflC (stomatin/prohibitin superfamily)